MTKQHTGLVFLSHANDDKSYVKQVKRQLDSANLFYDIDSIAPGEPTLDAMERGINDASVFVLFLSPRSKTIWVKLETEFARLAKIGDGKLEILVCPIQGETYKSLPRWMQRYMTAPNQFTPRDIARTINFLFAKVIEATNGYLKRPYEGREDLERLITLDIMGAPSNYGVQRNVILLTGLPGVGRATLAKHLIPKAFPGMRPGGPVFDLTDAADAIDWHLKFFEDLNGTLSPTEMANQIDAFPFTDVEQQAKYICASLAHWAEQNQVVTIRSRWSLRERNRAIKPWVKSLFNELGAIPGARLIVISDRKIPAELLADHKNVGQFSVEPLADQTISFVLASSISPRFLKHEKLPAVAKRIHGHAATADRVTYLVNSGLSLDSLNEYPEPIHSFQDKMLQVLFSSSMLDELEIAILKLLSWFPRLPSDLLANVFDDTMRSKVFAALWSLNEHSIIEADESGQYRILPLILSSFRRSGKAAKDQHFDKAVSILRERFASGTLSIDLVESLLIGVVAADGELSEDLTKIITAAQLLTVVEREYYLGRDYDVGEMNEHFQLAYSLSELALHMPCPDDTLESVLFYGADAQIRSGQNPSERISAMEKRGFSSSHYLRGSYLYHKERKYKEAAEHIERAMASGHFVRRCARLLGRIYIRMGQFKKALDALDRVKEASLLNDTSLVVTKIRALKGLRRTEEAAELQSRIGSLDDEYGDLSILHCGQAFREGNYPLAKAYLATANSAPKSNKMTLKFLECAIAIEEGNFHLIPDASALAIASGRDSDAYQLQARAAVVAKDWKTADDLLAKIDFKDYFDRTIELRMLNLKLADPSINRNPALQKETSARKEEVLRQLANSVEGARF